MKKLFLFALATAMMAFAGCQNQELEAPNTTNDGSTFELVADILQTKTSLNASTYEVDWEAGDVVYLVTSDGTWGQPYDQDNSATTVAEFTYADGRFTSTASIAAGEYTFKAMYADASQKSYHRGASSTHKLLAAQTQNCANPTAHIKANDALVGTFTATVPVPANEKAAVTMSHLYTLMQVDVKNNTGAAIEVKKFEMTAAGADLAGIFNVVAFDTPAITTKQNASSTITVNLTGGNVAAGESLPVYFVMAPLSNYAGDVTFKVTDSQGKTYTKTVAMNGISFAAGTYNTTPYTLTTPDVVTPSGGSSTWTLVTDALDLAVGDKIVIAALNSNFAMGAASSNGNNRTTVAITKSDNHINITDDVQEITLKPGAKASTFAFDTGSGYLYAASSSSNYLKTKSDLDENGSWQIEIAGTGVATIKAQGASTRNWIRFNETNNMFSCYGSGQEDVAIYRLQDSGSVPENYLNVSTTAIEVAADATTASFTVSSNLDWTATSDDAQVTVNGDVVNVTFEANMEEADQTYVVTVSAEGVDSKTVTITQAGVATEPEGPRVVTVAEFLAAPESETVMYQLTGTISGIYNTTYGNFYLTDAAGTKVLIYGLRESESASNTTFAKLGLKNGDKVTLVGIRSSHNGTEQAKNTYHVSSEKLASWDMPSITCSNNTVTIASSEAVTLYYTLDGTTPSVNSTRYTEPIAIETDVVVKAIAVAEGRPQSSVAQCNATYVEIEEGGIIETPITSWTLVSSAYKEKATVNGVSVDVLKLGTSKLAGQAMIKLPAGTVKVSYTAVAWNGKQATLLFKNGTTTVHSQKLTANSGAANNSPYTMTVKSTDTYEFEYAVDAEAFLTLDTTNSTSGNQRALIWNIVAYVQN